MSANGTAGGSPARPASPHPSLEELAEALAGLDVDLPDIAHHLESCEVCAEEIRELDAIAAALADLPLVPMPADVWDRTLERLSGAGRRRRVPTWAAAVTGVAAAVVGVGMLSVVLDGGGSDTTTPTSESLDSGSAGAQADRPATPGDLAAPTAPSCGTFGVADATGWRAALSGSSAGQVSGPAGIVVELSAGRDAVTVAAPADVNVVLTAATGGPTTVLMAGAADGLRVGHAPLDSVLVCFQR